MRHQRIIPFVLSALLLTLSFSLPAKADDWDKKTIVTFDQDVEIPGQVLPAGTYVFKLLRNASARSVVQVWSGDESQILASLITIGDTYPNPDGKSYFVLDMSGTDEGFPPAIVSWFFAGSDDGRDFIYSGYSTTQMLTSQSQPEQ